MSERQRSDMFNEMHIPDHNFNGNKIDQPERKTMLLKKIQIPMYKISDCRIPLDRVRQHNAMNNKIFKEREHNIYYTSMFILPLSNFFNFYPNDANSFDTFILYYFPFFYLPIFRLATINWHWKKVSLRLTTNRSFHFPT